MNSPLYPLTFHTIFKDKIWGGQKIRKILGKDFGALPNCGETWEISGVAGNVSVVKDGPLAGTSLRELVEQYGARLVGDAVYQRFGNEFPLLVKFIDANDDLSIQVHPDDALAQARHDSFGKTEMWYIMQADRDASLITGFNRALDRATYAEIFAEGRLSEVLNREWAEAGDVFFLPAGRVHTIGKGLLLAEIQQTSDITYRIYDFDRVDDAGNRRELHVEEALDAIDYEWYPDYKTSYPQTENHAVPLAECEYFHTSKLVLTEPMRRDYHEIDSFVILVVVEGEGILRWEGREIPLSRGLALLIPAEINSLDLIPDGYVTVLEAVVPG